jgi:nucleoside-diphosphate-sugar epimerase
MINVFGGKGYVGSAYTSKYECIVNDRNDLTPKSNDILYMISTVDNYSVSTNPFVDIETNLTTLMRVLEKCKDNPDTVFNFVSSWFVYGDTELPAKEESPCNPKGFYSITKRTAEQLLISYCETFNIKYRILRFANVVGGNDKKTSKKKNALTYLINEIGANRDIELYDNGDFYRDYIHISDLCRAVNLIVTVGEHNTIYNVGNGIPVNFGDSIRYAKKISMSTSQIKNIPQADFHKIVQVKSMYMENSKLKKLGYRENYSAQEIIQELVFDCAMS